MVAEHFPDPQLPSEESTSSFWLKQPDEFLLGHRTTAELPTEADIVIIGSGIAGAQTARYLSEQDNGAWIKGRKIVMLEAREACWGATGRNGGHCKPSLYAYPRLQHLFDDLGISETLTAINFELRNLSLLTSYIQENGIDCDFHRVPSCDAYFDQQSFSLAVHSIQTLRQHAPELADKLTIVTDKPTLTSLRIPTAVGAITIKDAAKLWPYKLVSYILKDLIKSESLNLQTSTPVLAISTLNDGAPVPLHRVHTPRGALTAPIVIHATNAFASHLVPAMRDMIYPVRAQMSALSPPKSLIAEPLTHTYGLVDGERIKAEYLVQEDIHADGTGGAFLLGGGRKYAKNQGVGITDDNHVDSEVGDYLRGSVGKYFDAECGYPAADKDKMCDAQYMWSGIMGFSADERPWVGKVPGTEGQYILAGFEGHGMAYTTGSAKALAEILRYRYPVLPEEVYSTYWNRNICMALYDYQGQKTAEMENVMVRGQELTIRHGDVVEVIEKGHNGWWFGCTIKSVDQEKLNTFGWFPSNFVEELPHGHENGVFEPSMYARLQEYPEEIFSWFPRSFTVNEERLKNARKVVDMGGLETFRSRARGVAAANKDQEEEEKRREEEEKEEEIYREMLYERYKLQFAVKLAECGKDEDNLFPSLESTALTNIEQKYLDAPVHIIRKSKLAKPLKQLVKLSGTETHKIDQARIAAILSRLSHAKEEEGNSGRAKGKERRAPRIDKEELKALIKTQVGDIHKRYEERRAAKPAPSSTAGCSCQCSKHDIVVRDFAVEAAQTVVKDLRASQTLERHPLVRGLRTEDAKEGDEWVVIVNDRGD